MSAGAQAQPIHYRFARHTSDFLNIQKIIDQNFSQLKKSGALFVRPGYEEKNGWITNRPAIVVTVASKGATAPNQQLPDELSGYPVDVRQATTLEKLRADDPLRYAHFVHDARQEYAIATPEAERNLATGEPAATTLSAALEARSVKPQVAYTPAPGVALDPLNVPVSLTCHASPDTGWPELEAFLNSVQSKLVVGLYDFTSAHILDALRTLFQQKGVDFTLTLDDPKKNPTADQTDPQTVDNLDQALGEHKFHHAWALERSNPMAQAWIFPNAYHIKVAVADDKRVWLSSGNWNNSNQPEIDPWNDPEGAGVIAKKSDRDWHVIIESEKVAAVFEAYLKHDFGVASNPLPPGEMPAAAQGMHAAPLPTNLSDAEMQDLTAEFQIAAAAPKQFFKPKDISSAPGETTKIQPILTPDPGCYSSSVLELIRSARNTLYMQTQYIHPSDKADDQKFADLIDAVIERQRSGVDVRIILSQWELQNGWLDRLNQTGLDMNSVSIQPGVHNKGIVVDSRVVMLGSQNWSGDGVLRNRDASVIIYHADAAKYYEQIFLHDWTYLAKQSTRWAMATAAAAAASGDALRRAS